MNHNMLLTDQNEYENVLLIDGDGKNHGSVSIQTALRMAEEAGLDAVLVSQGDSPVCKIMDFNKSEYDRHRKEKESKKNQKAQKLKEIRMNYGISENDLEVKIKKISDFLEKGHRVKISIGGKSIRNRVLAEEKLSDFMEKVRSCIELPYNVDSEPQMGTWDYTINIAPTKETIEYVSNKNLCLAQKRE